MIILDEPTAAIDPLEEADIYRKFAEISADKTAFIVTHRLGSARIADRIIVILKVVKYILKTSTDVYSKLL